jgi:hypothetical protein
MKYFLFNRVVTELVAFSIHGYPASTDIYSIDNINKREFGIAKEGVYAMLTCLIG